MNDLKRAVLATLLVLVCSPAGASETFSLRDALVIGLQHNYDLHAVRLEIERAEGGVLGEEGRFDVVAELVAGVSEAETPLASGLFAGETLETEQISGELALSKLFATGLQSRLALQGNRTEGLAGEQGLFSDQLNPSYYAALVLDLSQPLLRDRGGDVNTADLKVAEARRRQAAFGYLERAEQLSAEIELAYLEVVQADAEYRYYTLARDLAAELLAGNERKFEAGLIPVTEVNEARSAMAGREESMLLARQRLVLARNALVDLIAHGEARLPGGDWQVTFPVLAERPVPDFEAALEIGLERRPDLQQARLETEARKIALVYAGNQRWPRLDLEASLGVNGLAGDDRGSGSPYAGGWGDALDGALAEDGTQWYAGVRFSMPLQNRGARGRYLAAEAEDRQALYALRRAEVAVETAIRSARQACELGEQRLQVAQRYAALADATLEQENRRLREGLSDTFRVLTFQNALVDARIRETAARVDYHKAIATLYRAMGINLERYDIVAALPQQGVLP